MLLKTNAEQDFFCREGHIRLALDLLRDSVAVIAKDPNLETAEARAELAWLRGEDSGCLLEVGPVYDSMTLTEWARPFAELAEKDPVLLAERLREVSRNIGSYFSGDDFMYEALGLPPLEEAAPVVDAGPQAAANQDDEFETTMTEYVERARMC